MAPVTGTQTSEHVKRRSSLLEGTAEADETDTFLTIAIPTNIQAPVGKVLEVRWEVNIDEPSGGLITTYFWNTLTSDLWAGVDANEWSILETNNMAVIITRKTFKLTDIATEVGGQALNENFTKLGDDIEARPEMLTVTGTGYDGDPNDGAAPAIFTTVPIGCMYQQETPNPAEWRKNPDGTWVDQRLPASLQVRQDKVGNFTYIGRSLPGELTSAAVWRIFRLEKNPSDAEVLFADGDGNFNNVWDDHLTLSYS